MALVCAAVIYALFAYSFIYLLDVFLPEDYWNITCITIGAVSLAIYCFKGNALKIGNILYTFGFASYIVMCSYFVINDITDTHTDILNVLYHSSLIVAAIFMLLLRYKKNTIAKMATAAGIALYALLQVYFSAKELSEGYFNIYYIMYEAYAYVELVAFVLLYLIESGFVGNKVAPMSTQTTLEESLKSLKQMYENNLITEDEYTQKKSDLLNKF